MKFITFEGIDGCGKTTLINSLKDQAEVLFPNKTCHFVNDPSSEIPNCKYIRNILLNPLTTILPEERMSLYIRAREFLSQYVLENCRGEDSVVFCDRYIHSTYAYQCGGEYHSEESLKVLTKKHNPNYMIPTATIYLDINVEESRRRVALGRGVKDAVEKNDDAYYARVLGRYRQFIGSRNFHTIDGLNNPSYVFKEVVEILKKIIQ